MQLENAIQEAMAELDKVTESSKDQKITGRSCKVTGSRGPENGGASKQEGKRSSKKSIGSLNPVTAEQKECRWSVSIDSQTTQLRLRWCDGEISSVRRKIEEAVEAFVIKRFRHSTCSTLFSKFPADDLLFSLTMCGSFVLYSIGIISETFLIEYVDRSKFYEDALLYNSYRTRLILSNTILGASDFPKALRELYFKFFIRYIQYCLLYCDHIFV